MAKVVSHLRNALCWSMGLLALLACCIGLRSIWVEDVAWIVPALPTSTDSLQASVTSSFGSVSVHWLHTWVEPAIGARRAPRGVEVDSRSHPFWSSNVPGIDRRAYVLNWITFDAQAHAAHSPVITLADGRRCQRFSYEVTVQAPLWAPALLLGIWPTVRLFRWRKRRRRARRGACLACGYDLRATTGCCPECGAARVLVLKTRDARRVSGMRDGA